MKDTVFALRKLYDFTLHLASTKYALSALIVVSFLESSVFPIPPDVLLIPMILASPSRAFLLAGVCLAASVLGGLLGYYIGVFAFEELGRPILEFWNKESFFDRFATRYNTYGVWAVLVAGVTPFPYKVITILSGFTGLSIWIFIVSSVIARGTRFFLIAILLWRFGEPIKHFIETKLRLLIIVFLTLLIGSFIIVGFL